jgi:hypothetical protein
MIGRLLTRGPAAAKRPALNESGRPRADPNHRARSLFARKITSSSSGLQSTESPASTRLSQQIDLEGIANDGFGYTVSITAIPVTEGSEGRATMWKALKRRHRKQPESNSSPGTSGRSRSDSRRRGSYALDDKDIEAGGQMSEKPGIQVMTRNSFDVRESYHEPDERGWDVRNPYAHRPQEGEIEIGIERSASRVSDWSVLNEATAEKMVLPHVPEDGGSMHWRQSSLGNNLPRKPMSSMGVTSRRGSKETSNSGGERRRPHTADRPLSPASAYRSSAMDSHRFDRSSPESHRFGSPQLPTLQPQSALLAPSRMARAASPVVQPLNSSQPWAYSPRVSNAGSRYAPQSIRSGKTWNTATEYGETWPLPEPIDAVVNIPWEAGGHFSYHSSVAARDGSRESLVIGEDSQNPPDDDVPASPTTVPGSPASISLPIHGPLINRSNV